MIYSILNAMVFGIIAGVVVGLIPFFIGKSKNQDKLAIYSLVACAVSGAVLGLLLAIPVAGVCSFLIYNRDKNEIICPYCKEYVNKDATVCKHCRQEIKVNEKL